MGQHRVFCARMEAVRTNLNVRIIEQPQYKRRWTLRNAPGELAKSACEWALSRIEESVREVSARPVRAIVSAWLKAESVRTSHVKPLLATIS